MKSEAPIAEKAITKFIETNKNWVLENSPQIARIKEDIEKLEFQKEELSEEVFELEQAKKNIDET